MKTIKLQIKLPNQELFATKDIDPDLPEFAVEAERLKLLDKMLKAATYEVVEDVVEENE